MLHIRNITLSFLLSTPIIQSDINHPYHQLCNHPYTTHIFSFQQKNHKNSYSHFLFEEEIPNEESTSYRRRKKRQQISNQLTSKNYM